MGITTNEILIPKKLFGAKLERELEFDSALPDYCPDIARLVKVDCTPFLESCTIEGDKAIVSGKAVYDVLYETDYKNRLRCCSFTQEFSQSVTLPRSAAIDPTAFGKTRCERISCKLLSPRRLIIKTTLGTQLDIEGETAVKALAVSEDGETFFRKKTIGFEGRTAVYNETFRFGDSLPLNQGEKSVGEIVCGNIVLQEPQITLSPGRAEIKTTASVHALCEEEESEGRYYMSVKNLPINIDYQNDTIEDFKHISVELTPCETEISTELDQYGENRIIKTSFAVKAKLLINEPKAYTVADDMFEKGYDSTLLTASAFMPRLNTKTESSFSTETKLQSMTPKPETVLDSSARDYGTSVEKTEGGVNISGSFIVTLIADTAEGIHSFDHSVPYNQFIPIDLPDSEYSVVADTYPLEVISTLHSDGSVTVRIIANAKIYVYTESEESFVTDVTKRVAVESANNGSELIYFFPQSDEDLWNVAKLYRVSPNSISETNPSLFDESGRQVDSGKPILIKI